MKFTKTIYTPGNLGKDCLYNGEHEGIECCCDECDYLLCCISDIDQNVCLTCTEIRCPRSLATDRHKPDYYI